MQGFLALRVAVAVEQTGGDPHAQRLIALAERAGRQHAGAVVLQQVPGQDGPGGHPMSYLAALALTIFTSMSFAEDQGKQRYARY
jgi:hypothetical protein